MSQRSKHPKPNKTVFTIVADRLHEDSSQQLYGQAFLPQNDFNLLGYEFPLNYEIQEIHQSPQATELSAYILHLQSQVKSITNKIEYEYHQARQTVLFIGQTTNISKNITRKKVDQEFVKMGIIRKYQPNLKIQIQDIDEETLAKEAGDLAIDQVKRKIQLEWQCQISDEMEKERRRLREVEKKRLKELEQIDKDFEKLMKKRKTQRQLQAQLKSQQSMKSVQNGDSSSNRTPKKIQKQQKVQRKGSQKEVNNKKQSNQGSVNQKNSIQQSQIQSCSLNKQEESHSEQVNGKLQNNQ